MSSPLALFVTSATEPPPPFDWWNVVLVVATVLTAYATLYALWQRRHYNPQPAWTTTSRGYVDQPDSYNPDVTPTTTMTIINVGDGDAHNVRWEVLGLKSFEPHKSPSTPIGRLPSGQSFEVGLILDAPVSGEMRLSETTGYYEDERKFDVSEARVKVTWSQPPKRDKIRTKSFPVVIAKSYEP